VSLAFPFETIMELMSNRNINVPWPTKGMGDADYMYAFQRMVMPVAQQFDPDLVISTYARRQTYESADGSSCGWLRRRHRGPAWGLLRLPGMLCSHDPHADVSRERESGCLSRGMSIHFSNPCKPNLS
jgi:hypothetical protein